MSEESALRRELDAARATIAGQAIEIHALRQRATESTARATMQELLTLADIVGATVGSAPYRALLDGIVAAAARIFEAGAASIALLDHDTNELVFEAASNDEEVVGMRFPAHQGIAGWVVMTGEAIAVSDVRRDPRFAKDFAQSTGYVPNSILAVPLLVRDEVEGVLEVLDKATAASFGLADMDLLSLFARPAAVAVEQARMVSGVGSLLVRELGRLAGERGQSELAGAAEQALESGSTVTDQTLELAALIHRLARRSERTREVAIEILTSMSRLPG